METMYYSLNARKVKVSGGADLLTFVPAPVVTPAVQTAQILDFDRCRRRLETKAAWQELASAAQEEEPAEALPVAQTRRERRDRLGGVLELAASAAVLLVSIAAAMAFFSLL